MTDVAKTSLQSATTISWIDGVSVPPIIPPLLVGLSGGLICHRFELAPAYTDIGAVLSAAGTMASVGATMLGFMLAALAILASINHTHLVQMMRSTGHYSDLIGTLLIGSGVFLACAMTGFALLFGVPATPMFWALAIGVHCAALGSLADVGRKFARVLINLRP